VKIDLTHWTVDYLDTGGPSPPQRNDLPVLLIHAFPLNNNMWAPQIGAIGERFRLIAPNVRGFGESQPTSAWTMEELADDLNRFLDQLRVSSCAVVGVSMGGYIALAFWLRHPRRTARLVLSNSRARADNDTEKAARNEMIAAIQHGGSAILPDRMLPRLLQPNAAPETVRTVRSMIEQTDAAAAAYAVMAMRDRMDFSSMLHRIACPAMVVTGENDVIIRVQDARSVAEGIAGARFVTIPDSGHLSSLENPDAFNAALVNFLG
jgi:pimeloyl-ACP methyl ester carboxylesterase